MIQVEISSICPGKCMYCPHTTMKDAWKSRLMAPETYVRLWPLFCETFRVHLQGWGEPLLHPDFLDMVAMARRAGCLVSTTTCGLFMKESLAADIVDSGMDIIVFSMTGSRAETHNAMRGGVDFEKLLDSIRLFQSVRKKKKGIHLEVHLAYLMMASQVEEVLRLPDLMESLGVHAAVVSTLDYIPGEGFEREAFLPEEREKIEDARKILDLAVQKAHEKGLSLYYALPEPEPLLKCLEDIGYSLYVDAEGLMSPCIYLNLPTEIPDPERRVFGSCLLENPVDVWKSEDFAAFRVALSTGKPDEVCVNCPKRFARVYPDE